MPRTRDEIAAFVVAFRDIYADRCAAHPDPVVRRNAKPVRLMYEDAARLAERGASLSAICGALGDYGRQLFGCREAIAAETAAWAAQRTEER